MFPTLEKNCKRKQKQIIFYCITPMCYAITFGKVMHNFSKPQVFKGNKISEGKNYLLSSNKGGVQDMQMAT